MRKSRLEEIAEALRCSRQETYVVLAVCMALLAGTGLFRYGRLAGGHNAEPRGKVEICTVPSVQDGRQDRLTPLRDQIFPADSADFSSFPDKRMAPMRERK